MSATTLRPSTISLADPGTALALDFIKVEGMRVRVGQCPPRQEPGRGTAVILITHDLGVVAGMSDRIQVMYAGTVVERADTYELFGNPRQLWSQLVATLAAIAWSALASWALLKLVGALVPLRVSARDEGLGLDVSQHGEEAYASAEGALLLLPQAEAAPRATLVPVSEGGRP